jgi:hypothetical protein
MARAPWLQACLLLAIVSIACATPPGCKKVLWFMAVGKNSNANYKTFVANALVSARLHAPSLVPHLIYDGDEDGFTDWVKQLGGVVCFHKLSFFSALKMLSEQGDRPPNAYKYYPPYMRLDVPLIVNSLEYSHEEVDMQHVLYTDVDVMFQKDINSCSLPHPKLMLVGPEFDKGVAANTGVMYLNVEKFRARLPGLLQHAYVNKFNFISHDQGLIMDYFKNDMALLPDEYNWKAYWGFNPNAAVLHFHGPKPGQCLLCCLKHERDFEKLCYTCPPLYIPLFTFAREMRTVSEYRRFVDLFFQYKSLGYYKDYLYELPKY